ncbi:phosphotransferase [Nocardia nepalensis]|uniref:phosphotransferase n=1 Tax=Nocardia nepalensis TaxID=3375448 RepID=UPI003B677BC9
MTQEPTPAHKPVLSGVGQGLSNAASDRPPGDDDVRGRGEIVKAPKNCGRNKFAAALLHTDLRPDNMVLRRNGTVAVIDWSWPCRGAAWIDLVALAPSIAASGVDPDPILAAHPSTRDVESAAIAAVSCALVGYWEHNSRQPAPPRSPNFRRHQAHSAQVSRAWLKRRLAWP